MCKYRRIQPATLISAKALLSIDNLFWTKYLTGFNKNI
jgi:hypothetical protein